MAEGPSVPERPEVAGRDEAVELLFRTHCVALVRLAVVLLGYRQEAEEVVQDAFVSLHRNWAGLRDTSAAGAYLRDAVIGGCRSRQRRLIRARRVAPKLVITSADSVEDIAIELDGLRLATLKAAGRLDAGQEAAQLVAEVRALTVTHASAIGSHAVQLLGGHGFVKDFDNERWFRDLRGAGVLEGTLLV